MGICAKEEEERLQEPEGIGGFKVITSTTHNWTDTYELTETMTNCQRPTQSHRRQNTALKRGSRNKVSPITKKLQFIYASKEFSPLDYHWVYYPQPRGDPCPEIVV